MNKLIIVFFSTILLSACSSNTSTVLPTSTQTFPTPQTSPTSIKTSPTTDTVVAIKTVYGQIVIKLYSKEAPNTVANFLKKIKNGFYTNLIFHRVDPGFVVQGGDPKGNGTGGGSIKSELNPIPFRIGSVGLARTPANQNISNDSQFFICLSTDSCAQLTGDYVNFGEVISGMDVVNQIKIGDKILEVTNNTK